MPTTDNPMDLTRANEYWGIVKRAFQEVLHQEDSGPVDVLRRTIAERPHEEQLLVYHREPLYTAADIAGMSVDDQMLGMYLQMTDRRGWKL